MPRAARQGLLSQVLAHIQLATYVAENGAPARLPGLEPETRYTLRVRPELSSAEDTRPAWARRSTALTVTGRIYAGAASLADQVSPR
ncbi:hypothetical protein ACWDBW_21080 [Streptomyces sp. NPDC001107]